MTRVGCIIIVLALLLGGCAPERDAVFVDGAKTWVYRADTINGWRVYLEKSLAGPNNKKLVDDLYKELRISFDNIEKAVPADAVKLLKEVPIWVSNEPDYPFRPRERGVIPFHRSPEWLREHGLNPHMAPGVHVINPAVVLYDHKMFEWGPQTILHELAHSYHNLHLGLTNAEVSGAYTRAIAKGLYLKVPDRVHPKKKVRAYAASNQEEYFAELTEAYFGPNDWYPKNRVELRSYDPGGYRMIESVWKIDPSKRDK
jgi:hypothetical protein